MKDQKRITIEIIRDVRQTLQIAIIQEFSQAICDLSHIAPKGVHNQVNFMDIWKNLNCIFVCIPVGPNSIYFILSSINLE